MVYNIIKKVIEEQVANQRTETGKLLFGIIHDSHTESPDGSSIRIWVVTRLMASADHGNKELSERGDTIEKLIMEEITFILSNGYSYSFERNHNGVYIAIDHDGDSINFTQGFETMYLVSILAGR